MKLMTLHCDVMGPEIMAGAANAVSEAKNIPVLTSPDTAVENLKRRFA